jgi:hypothetical protein
VARALTALGLAATSIALAACGSGGTVSADPVANAATKTAKVASYHVTTTTRMRLPNASKDLTFTGDGVFDPKARRGRMSLDLSQLSQLQGPQGSPYSFGYAQFVLNGTDMYMRIPLLRQLNPVLKPWIKIDLAQGGKAQGVDFSSFLQFGQGGDPTQTLQFLRATGRLQKVGAEDVRGVATTRYKGEIKLKNVPGAAPAKLRPGLRKAVERLIQLTGKTTIPVEVWVDKQGYVRRETYTEELKIQGRKTKVTDSMELYDFGGPVIAPLPPASDVTDLSGAGEGAQS